MNRFNKNKVLIYGFGRIAQIHAKYLNQLGIQWNWYDPYNTSESIKKVKQIDSKLIKEYSHVMICTPECIHYQNYKEIKNLDFKGKIFIEKPAVISLNELYILKDKNVQVGLVERFNPCIDVLRQYTTEDECISIDFSRCSFSPLSNKKVNTFLDVAIHDIDLFFYIFNNPTIENYDLFRSKQTFTLNIVFNHGSIARFIWSNDTYSKERIINLRMTSSTLKCDLIDQTVKKYTSLTSMDNLYVEKSSPVKRELEFFLKDKGRYCYQDSHLFFLSCLNKLSKY